MRALLTLGLVVGLVGFVTAADDKKPDDKKADTAKKADPSGTWKWETEFGGQKRTSTLKLQMEKDKLSGVMIGMDGKEVKIDDAEYKDGDVSFSVTREFNDTKFTMKYKAKIDGDTIKGAATANFGGEERKIEFEGKREKGDKKEEKKDEKKDK